MTVQLGAPGRLPRGDQFTFDAAGRLRARVGYATGPAALQVYSPTAQVHFGFFGGVPVRIAYGVLGAALTYICASGVSIWLARRRDRGRPARLLDLAWTGWTLGAPVALALTFALGRAAAPGMVFWCAVALALAASVLRAPFAARSETIAA